MSPYEQAAFPFTTEIQSNDSQTGEMRFGEPGMTMRQYYKAAALTGFMAVHGGKNSPSDQLIASWCGDAADAMLAEDKQHAEGDDHAPK